MKKVLALLLVLCMVIPFAVACTDPVEPNVVPSTGYTDPYAGKTHAEVSADLYKKVLGEFQEYYNKAALATNVSERFALLAIAEAKMLESGIMLPGTANGGRYAISRVVPYTVTPTLWGSDSDRYHQVIVLAGDQAPLTSTERNELKALWNESTTSTEYEQKAKDYLTKKGYKISDTYSIAYTDDPSNWDVFDTNKSVDSEALVNTYDGLYEYDLKGNLAPALATGYTVSEDGLTYTFTIREGVQWVSYDGKKIADLTAQDFVDGMHHMLDCQGDLTYLVEGIIKNAAEYVSGDITDFSQVGVKAVDGKLVYTLEAPCSYFTTMLGYSVFAPLCATYFQANGGAFGVDAFAEAKEADTYTYGNDYTKIAYCGPYLVKAHTKTNSLVFTANTSYWNADNINIKTLNWLFSDGSDPTWAYTKMKAGELAAAALTDAVLQTAKNDIVASTGKSWYEMYSYTSGLDANTYPTFYNLYRCQYGNYNDDSVAASTLTDSQKLLANAAMQNQNFRLALSHALDRGAYNATVNGEDLKLVSLTNSYTPGNFVFLEEDVTVQINGKDTKFEKGTYYGAIMQAQIDADGYKMKVWDPTLEAGVGSGTGFDGWYNVTAAKEYLQAAIAELEALGLEVTKDNPIVLEMPYYDIYSVYANRANAYKQSIEASLDGYVVISLVKTGGTNAKNWYYAGYYPTTGDYMNYNIFDGCGWGPDYGDPGTYLDTILPQGGGLAKNIGLY